jgi:hypothetical protein
MGAAGLRTDNRSTMRTLGFRSHIMLALLSAAGVVYALGMPWFGSAPEGDAYLDGAMDRTLEVIGRAVAASDGMSGRETLAGSAQTVTLLAGLTGLMALLCLSDALFGVARQGLRLGALATVGVIAWRLVDHPADELRHGALIGAAAALVLTASALAAASAPVRRNRGPVFGHPGVHVPLPPPPRWETAESAPPPTR